MAYRMVNHLSTEVSAYIAGLIDGEGTITLEKKHRNNYRCLSISISSTEPKLLNFVQEQTGVGHISTKRRYSNNHARGFAWCVRNRQAYALLKQIHPYLLSYKKKRADLILDRYLDVTPRNGKYSDSLRTRKLTFETELLTIKPEKIEEPAAAYAA